MLVPLGHLLLSRIKTFIFKDLQSFGISPCGGFRDLEGMVGVPFCGQTNACLDTFLLGDRDFAYSQLKSRLASSFGSALIRVHAKRAVVEKSVQLLRCGKEFEDPVSLILYKLHLAVPSLDFFTRLDISSCDT